MSTLKRLRSAHRSTIAIIVLALVFSASSGTFCAALTGSMDAMSCCQKSGMPTGPVATPCCNVAGERQISSAPATPAVLHAFIALPGFLHNAPTRLRPSAPPATSLPAVDIRLLASVFLI